MIPKPKEAVDISWNWVGWKVPVNHNVNLNYQDRLDLAKICWEYCQYHYVGNPPLKFADVGACIGNATSILAYYANQFKDGKVVSMDTFADRQDWPGQKTKECWVNNMHGLGYGKITNLRIEKSTDVAKEYLDESFDIVYIDASHIYKDIKDDIAAWWPKVKKHGFIAGHDCELNATQEQLIEIKKEPLWDVDDCTKHGHAGVIVATKEFFGDKLQQKNHTWWVQK